MTNDEYATIERALSRGQGLTPREGRLLLDQLQENARKYIALEVGANGALARGRAAERAALDELRGMAGMETLRKDLRYQIDCGGWDAEYTDAVAALLKLLGGET